MSSIYIVIALLIASASIADGQGIISQWVSNVRTESSRAGTGSYGSAQIIGPPNVYPTYCDCSSAWAPASFLTSNEFIEFEVNSSICVSSIETFETFHAGFVVRILAMMPDGTWDQLWNGTTTYLTTTRVFSPPLRSVWYTTKVFRIYMSFGQTPDLGELDAVRINGSQVCPGAISQWVSSVRTESSRSGTGSYGSAQIIGPPNVYPSYCDCSGSWAPSTFQTSNEFIEFEVNSSICVTSMETFETFNTGFVVRILAMMPDGTWDQLWNGTATYLTTTRIFSPPLRSVSYTTKIFRIYMNFGQTPNLGELDAVRINGSLVCQGIISQWVSSVRTESSRAGTGSYGSAQIIGPPNVYPTYCDCSSSWAPASFLTSNEFIEFEVNSSICVTSIETFETFHSGFVVRILAMMPDGTWDQLWNGTATYMTTVRVFSPPLRTVSYTTKVFRIYMSFGQTPDLGELDAIRINGTLSCTGAAWVPVPTVATTAETTAPTTMAVTTAATTVAATTVYTTVAATTIPTTLAATMVPTTVAATTVPTTAPATTVSTTAAETTVPTTAPATTIPTTVAATTAPTTMATTVTPAATTVTPTTAPTAAATTTKAQTTTSAAVTTASSPTAAPTTAPASANTGTQSQQTTTTPNVIAICIAVDHGIKAGFNDSVSTWPYINAQMAKLQTSPVGLSYAIVSTVTSLLKCLLQPLQAQLTNADYTQINATLVTLGSTCTQFEPSAYNDVATIYEMGAGSASSASLQGIRKSLSMICGEKLFKYCPPTTVPVAELDAKMKEVDAERMKDIPPGGSLTIKTADTQVDYIPPGPAKISSVAGTAIDLPDMGGIAVSVKATTTNPYPNAAGAKDVVGPMISIGAMGDGADKSDKSFTIKIPITQDFAKVNTTAAQNQTNTTGVAKRLVHEFTNLKAGNPFYFTLSPSSPNAKYTVLVWYKSKPDDGDEDMKVSLPTSSATPYMVQVKSALIAAGRSVYISVSSDGSASGRRKRSTDDFDLSAVQLGCKYFNATLGAFQDDAEVCQVDDASTPTNVAFKSNYFGSFSAAVFTPPNKIDFSTVFGRFSELSSNYSVLVTLCGLAALYFALLPFMIYLDRQDGKQWKFMPLLQGDVGGQFLYEISVFTSIGWRKGTDAPVSFELIGDRGCSITRRLDDGVHHGFPSRSQRNFLLTLHRHIGQLSGLTVTLHKEKHQPHATWSLQNIAVRDCTTGQRYDFHNQRLLCTRKNARVRLTTRRFATYATMQADVMGKSKNDLCEEHLWVSVFTRPTQTPFGRAERLTCCLSILLLSMLTNMMFYNTDSNVKGNHSVDIGPFSFTIHGVYVSVISTLLVLPANMAAMLIFKKTPPLRAPKAKKYAVLEADDDEKKPLQLPRGLRVVAWLLLFVAVVASLFFMLLYSIEFGDDKSRQWLASVFLSMFQDIFVMNPMKVIVLVTAFSFCFVSKTVRGNEYSSAKEYHQAKHYKAQDHKLALKLRTAIARICCILLIAFLCANQRDFTTFLQNQSANQQFTLYVKQFQQINSVKAMWNWTKTRLVPRLFPADKLARNVSDTYFYRLGAVRLRQMTVNTTDCVVPAPLNQWLAVRPCYPFYDADMSMDKDLFSMRAKASNDSGPSSSYSVSGRFATYPMIGPYVDLQGAASSAKYIHQLESTSFIGRHTRAIVLEWNYYNPNTNLFTLMRVLFEMPPVGGVVATKFVRTVRLYTYTEDTGLLYMILQGLFCVSVVGNLVSLIYQTTKQGVPYLKQFWTILQGCYILVSCAAIGTFVYRTSAIINTVTTVMNNRDAYVSLDTVADYDDAFSMLLATVQLIAVLSMMQLLDFNRYVALFSATLGETSRVLITYGVLFGILIFSYTMFSTIVFSPSMEQFHDFYTSVSTLFSMTLGSTLYSQLIQVDLTLGRFFYLTFMLIVFLVMTNLFVTLINSNYDHVKRQPLSEWFDKDLVEHLINKFSVTLRMKPKDGTKRLTDEDDDGDHVQPVNGKQDARTLVEHRLDDLYFRVDSYFGH